MSGVETSDGRAGVVPAIRIRGYDHTYPSEKDGQLRLVEALRGIDLSIGSGEFVSFLGPSGCGKTTLLNVLGGLEAPQSDDIRILGEPPRAGRTDIAYMFARPALFPWLTVLQNVLLGMEVRQLNEQERLPRAQRFIQSVGLGGFEDAYPGQLSQGMRQRAALARTFSLNSPILLMDEPFGALDAQTKLTLQELLMELFEEGGKKTVVFVTHDLGEAIALSDRVVVFSDRPGRIIKDYKVPLSHPRVVEELQGQASYHEVYAELWQTLAQAKRNTQGGH
ncbi:Bicarbonate transport ATP-binding protein CmpC [Variovorax sp. PBL-E5]|nr:Bicarbonate transport ATP-binding protein CmpC [Variovorax sp. PBL-E5]